MLLSLIPKEWLLGGLAILFVGGIMWFLYSQNQTLVENYSKAQAENAVLQSTIHTQQKLTEKLQGSISDIIQDNLDLNNKFNAISKDLDKDREAIINAEGRLDALSERKKGLIERVITRATNERLCGITQATECSNGGN